MAVAFDERIGHQPHLVQANMNGRISNAAKALFSRVVQLAAAKTNMALQGFAVVGQRRQYLTRGSCADIAVVVKASGYDGFVIGNDLTAQLGQYAV